METLIKNNIEIIITVEGDDNTKRHGTACIYRTSDGQIEISTSYPSIIDIKSDLVIVKLKKSHADKLGHRIDWHFPKYNK